MKETVKTEFVLSRLSCIQLFGSPWTVAHQAPLSMRFSSKNTGVGYHAFLQAIFRTQELNSSLLCVLHCGWILYHGATGATGEAPEVVKTSVICG